MGEKLTAFRKQKLRNIASELVEVGVDILEDFSDLIRAELIVKSEEELATYEECLINMIYDKATCFIVTDTRDNKQYIKRNRNEISKETGIQKENITSNAHRGTCIKGVLKVEKVEMTSNQLQKGLVNIVSEESIPYVANLRDTRRCELAYNVGKNAMKWKALKVVDTKTGITTVYDNLMKFANKMKAKECDLYVYIRNNIRYKKRYLLEVVKEGTVSTKGSDYKC